jgi:hypothetical protein
MGGQPEETLWAALARRWLAAGRPPKQTRPAMPETPPAGR